MSSAVSRKGYGAHRKMARRNCYRYFTVKGANIIAFIFDLACVLYIVRENFTGKYHTRLFHPRFRSRAAPRRQAELGLGTRAPVFVDVISAK